MYELYFFCLLVRVRLTFVALLIRFERCVQIEEHKLEIKAQSKVGSLDNVKYKPGGGDKKIFDDKEYLKQMAATSGAKLESEHASASQVCHFSIDA